MRFFIAFLFLAFAIVAAEHVSFLSIPKGGGIFSDAVNKAESVMPSAKEQAAKYDEKTAQTKKELEQKAKELEKQTKAKAKELEAQAKAKTKELKGQATEKLDQAQKEGNGWFQKLKSKFE